MLEIKSGLSAVRDNLKDNEVYLGDARELLPRIEPESVALSFWSPPYYVGKSYEKHLSFGDWQALLRDVIALSRGRDRLPQQRLSARRVCWRVGCEGLCGYDVQALHALEVASVVGEQGEVVPYGGCADIDVRVFNALTRFPEPAPLHREYAANLRI